MIGGAGTQFGRLAGVRLYPLVGTPLWINPAQPRTNGIRLIPDLRVSFRVEKSTSSEPQRAVVEISNLGKLHRDLIATFARRPKGVTSAGLTVDGRVFAGCKVEILAGYEGMGGGGAIFRGDLSAVQSRHLGTDWITTLELGDSEAAMTQAEVAQSFPPGTPAIAVIQACAASLGLLLGPTPIPTALASYVLERGWTAYGRARDTIDAILAGCAPDLSALPATIKAAATLASLVGLLSGPSPLTRPIGWHVDDGLLYLLPRYTALPGPPILVSAIAQPGTVRLIDRPERLDDGAVRLRTLLCPQAAPAWPVVVTSRELQGSYRVDEIEHDGDNRGGDFATTMTVRPTIPL